MAQDEDSSGLSGALDASFDLGTERPGAVLGLSLRHDLCSQPPCALSVGGAFDVGFSSGTTTERSTTWMALAPELALSSRGDLRVGASIKVGVWAGARNQGLDLGVVGGATGWLGLPLSKTLSASLQFDALLLQNEQSLWVFGPGLGIQWRPQ